MARVTVVIELEARDTMTRAELSNLLLRALSKDKNLMRDTKVIGTAYYRTDEFDAHMRGQKPRVVRKITVAKPEEV